MSFQRKLKDHTIRRICPHKNEGIKHHAHATDMEESTPHKKTK
jgi:hypothetical protein